MTTILNREIYEILNGAKQSAYLEDLHNLFTDLSDDYEEEKIDSEKNLLESLSKIFSIQFELFLKKTHPVLYFFRSKTVLEIATQYVFSNSTDVQDDLLAEFHDLRYLITYNELASNFSSDFYLEYFEEKIGYDKVKDILVNMELPINRMNFYNVHIHNACNKHNINKKRFEDTFTNTDKYILLNNSIAYDDTQESLSYMFDESAKICSVMQSFIADKTFYLSKNNELLSVIVKPIDKEGFLDIIDWKLIINGNNPTIFKLLVENENDLFMLSVISKHLDLFISHKEWIIEEQSKLNVVTDFSKLIEKAISNKNLNLKLPPKNSKKTISKI